MDNFYNSPNLAKLLYKQKTHVVGTLRMNRKNVPKDLTKLKLKSGDVQYRTCYPITYVWRDKRDVNFITRLHHASTAAVSGNANRETGQPIIKPVAILDYNRHMGAVDKYNQMVLVNLSVHKTLKWIKILFFHLLDLSTTNAYIFYCKQEKKVKRFVQQIIQHLVSSSFEDDDVARTAQSRRFGSESSMLPNISQSLFQQLNDSRNQDENAFFASLTEKKQANDGQKTNLADMLKTSTTVVVVKESQLCTYHLVSNCTIRTETTKVLSAKIIKLFVQFFFLFLNYEFS